MLIDLPDYTSANPWQSKTIDTCAPMVVTRRIDGNISKVKFLHLGWEDIFFGECTSEEQANTQAHKVGDQIRDWSRTAKIIWTVHNSTSHWLTFKSAESILRSVLMECASLIILMSPKHISVIDPAYRDKVRIVPHYIEPNPYESLQRRSTPTYFRYGASRRELGQGLYESILSDGSVDKFVSDERLSAEKDSERELLVKRKFSSSEAWLYARLSNFTTFFREASLNSGVFNFYLGNRLPIFSCREAVKYCDFPAFYSAFFSNDPDDKNAAISGELIESALSLIDSNSEELDEFLLKRSPEKVSAQFWHVLQEL